MSETNDSAKPATQDKGKNKNEDAKVLDFFAIHEIDDLRPSSVHKKYKDSFTYRLSELVFGSLIASYILGFISSTLSIVHESEISSHLRAFNPIYTIDHILVSGWIFGFTIITYVAISTIYAIFTANIYFNYHQSVMYMYTSTVRSPYDYLVSLFVAFTFGLSIIFPQYFLSIFLLLIVTVLIKKHHNSKIMIKSIVNEIFKKKIIPIDQIHISAKAEKINDSTERDRKSSEFLYKKISKIMNDEERIASSWSDVRWALYILLLVIASFLNLILSTSAFPPLGFQVFYAEYFAKTEYVSIFYIITASIFYILISVILFRSLINTSSALGFSDSEDHRNQADSALQSVIESCHKQIAELT